MMQVICSDADQALWKAERRKRITASSISTFLEIAPDFYTATKESLIADKLSGREEEFEHKSHVRMLHGREDEDHNAMKVGKMLGFPVARYHNLVSNERWPYLGASLDWLLFPVMGVGPELRYTNQIGQISDTWGRLDMLEDSGVRTVLLELKQTEAHRYADKGGGGKPWIRFVPDYHKPQVQTGMWLTGLEHAVLGAALGAADMTAWLLRRDPEWEGVMDKANAEAGELLGELWA